MRIALLYEHPTWSGSLIARAGERGIDLTPIDIGDPELDLSADFDLWVNRINAMPSAGRPTSIVAAAGHSLLTLELRGQRVLNGSQTHHIGGSKTAQATLFEQVGLATPASVAIYEPAHALDAAMRLGFPVLTKPNVGGSGAGIVRHDSADALRAAIGAGEVDLGIDGTGLVQRVIEAADGLIHRVEMLGSEFFYGTEQRLRADAFNYCAADGCAVDSEDAAIVLFTPPSEIIEQVAGVMAAASTDVGGVEYIVDATTGEPTFFDFNPYSNFVSDLDEQLGFNPIDRYLDFIISF